MNISQFAISFFLWDLSIDLDMIHISLRSSCLNSLSSQSSVFYLSYFYLFWYSSVWLANAPQGFNDTTRRCSFIFCRAGYMLIFLYMVFYIFRPGVSYQSYAVLHPAHSGVPFLISSAQFPPLPSLPFPATSHIWALACGYVCVTSSSPLVRRYTVEDLGA